MHFPGFLSSLLIDIWHSWQFLSSTELIPKVKERAIAAGIKSESRLNIELEPHILSLRDEEVLAGRDKTVHPEFSADSNDQNPKV